jgi:hypothetical protein
LPAFFRKLLASLFTRQRDEQGFPAVQTNLCAIAQMDFETFAYMPDLPFDTGQKG